MYTVKKLSVTSRHADGTPVYDYEFNYPSWTVLVVDLHYRSRHTNEIFVGRGSHIFCDGEVIGHTGTFDRIEGPINRVSLAQFLAQVAEDADE